MQQPAVTAAESLFEPQDFVQYVQSFLQEEMPLSALQVHSRLCQTTGLFAFGCAKQPV